MRPSGTRADQIVGSCDGELHHVGGERGEVPVERAFSPDTANEAVGGGALRVRSDRSEEFTEGGGNLALGGEGIQTKLDWLIGGRAVTLSGYGAKEIPVLGLVRVSAARRKMCSPGVPGVGPYGNTNFQFEFWEPGVGWVARPDVIPLLDEQPFARVD